MEGVRRISISIGNEKILKIRTPLNFKDLQGELLKLKLALGTTIKTKYQNSKVSISDDQSYFKWLKKCSFRGLALSFNTVPTKADNTAFRSRDSSPINSKSETKIPIKRPRSKSSTPKKQESNKKLKKTLEKNIKKSSDVISKRSKISRTPSKSPNPGKKPSAQSTPKTSSKSLKPSRKTTPRSLRSSSSPRSATNTTPKRPSPASKLPNKISPQKTTPKSLRSSNSPNPAANVTPTQASPASKLQSSTSKPFQLYSGVNSYSASPSKSNSTGLFSSFNNASSTGTSLFSQYNAFSTVQEDVNILKAFASIEDEGKLKVVDSETSKSRLIMNFSIKKSSRLLLTPDGILITGGSGAPYQVMLIKSDYSVLPLVSMNNPRFWHCTGYIDGYPAVAAGAVRSKAPKVFLNTVEVYKDGYWVNYPNTNINRASPCMSWNDKNVYIVGGVVTTGTVNTVVKEIEKFENGQWIILPVIMREPLISCGSVINGENELIIFGGEKSGGTLTSSIYSLNFSDNTTKDFKPLSFFTKFTYGQQAQNFNEKTMKCCDYQGRILNIELTKID